MIDTISDMLTRIRNANMVKHQIVQIPNTKMSYAIATILKEEGFIENFEVYNENSIVDLGEERNKNAVANGIAVWVETEKKEFTDIPKKEVKVKGKKIETK